MAEPAKKQNDSPDRQAGAGSSPGQPGLRPVKGGGESTPRSKDHLSPIDGGGQKNPDSAPPGSGGLKGLDGGGESSPRSKDHLKSAEDAGGAAGAGVASGSKGYDPANIKGREQFNPDSNSLFNAGGDQSDKDNGGRGLFNPKDKSHRGNMGKVLKGVGLNKRKLLIGGAGAGGLGMLAVIIFFVLLPLKIEHIITNLQQRFFASSEQAVEQQSEYMLSRYIKKHVLPALTSCPGSTIDKDCNVNLGVSDNPVTALYKGWADSRLEQRLAEKHGIEFHYNKTTKQYFMKVPGVTAPGGDNITSFKNEAGDLFTEVSRGEVRQHVRTAFDAETKWKKVMYRYKWGALMERKYGVKRCLVYCGSRDRIQDWKDKKVNVAQVFIAQRIVTPHLETTGILMQCLFSAACDPTHTAPNPDAPNGEPENPDVDTKTRSKFVELLGTYNITSKADIDKMIADYKTLSEGGFSNFFIKKTLEKIGLGAISDKVTSAIPVVQWFTTIAGFIDKAAHLGPTVAKLRYVAVASGGAVQAYSTFRTQTDELHTGNVDASMVGDWTNALGPGNPGDTSDPEVGGDAAAEDTPAYQHFINGDADPNPATALLKDVLPTKAYALGSSARAKASKYRCNDNNPVPGGKIVCSEEEFGKGSAAASSISSFFNSGFMGTISGLASFINSTVGQIAQHLPFNGFLSSIISNVPGVKSLTNLATSILSPFFTKVFTELIPNPFSTNMSGGRKFDMITAGADVSGNDFAHVGLGGKKLTKKRVAEIINQQEAERRQTFDHQSIFARMFSTDSQYSLVSRMAMATPIGLQHTAGASVASMLGNPVSSLFHGFGAAFSGRASAAVAAQDDPFGVTQYGYDADELRPDAEAYWNEHCSDNEAHAYQNDADFAAHNWNQDAADHPDGGDTGDGNGMPVNTDVNACLLIKSAVGSAGATADSDLLTDKDKADIAGADTTATGGTTGSTNTTATGTGTAVTGSSQDLAKQLIASGKLTGDPRYIGQIKAVSNGDFSCNVNPSILKMLAGVIVQDGHSLFISSLNRKCTGVLTASGTGSFHFASGGGHAIDVTKFDGADVVGSGAATISYLTEASKFLPTNTGYGQVLSCHSGFNIPSGSYAVPDTCDHQHIQVPVQQLQ